MTVVLADAAGVDRADRELAAGTAVVLPFPTPLPYVVAGCDAAAVNVAKGRPAGQAAGMLVADLDLVARYVQLDAETLAFARWLSGELLLNLMVPVAGGPAWLAPSTRDSWLALTVACRADMRQLVDHRGHLYLSSANSTGAEVAVTAAAADAAFDGRLLVINGDADRDPALASGSATIVRVEQGGRLTVVRPGVHGGGTEPDRFTAALTRRWTTAQGEVSGSGGR